MTSDRPYRKAFSKEEAVKILQRAGKTVGPASYQNLCRYPEQGNRGSPSLNRQCLINILFMFPTGSPYDILIIDRQKPVAGLYAGLPEMVPDISLTTRLLRIF